jgi:hypothetical protein
VTKYREKLGRGRKAREENRDLEMSKQKERDHRNFRSERGPLCKV